MESINQIDDVAVFESLIVETISALILRKIFNDLLILNHGRMVDLIKVLFFE